MPEAVRDGTSEGEGQDEGDGRTEGEGEGEGGPGRSKEVGPLG